jgi:hypothetical protein
MDERFLRPVLQAGLELDGMLATKIRLAEMA